MTPGAVVAAGALCAYGATACGGAASSTSPVTTIAGATTHRLAPLSVTVDGAPQRTYLLDVGWRVCDHGVVRNGGTVLAHDVRVVVTYVDRGTVIATTTRADAANNGGALGDIPAGDSHDFTVCATVRLEPDTDRVEAAPAG